MRWKSLFDRQTATLYEGSAGNGMTYSNIKGWGSTKQLANLTDVRFNDTLSAFRWESVSPAKEIIEPFDITATDSSNSSSLTSVINGFNKTSQVQPVVVTLNNQRAQSVTVETSDQHVASISASYSQTLGAGVEGVASTSSTWSVALSYSYTRTDTRTTSRTDTVDLNIAQTVNAPEYSRYKATLLVIIGQLPPTIYRTTAQRWYTSPVTGSTADPSNNGWYKRVEDVSISLAGSLAMKTNIFIESTPIETTTTSTPTPIR